MLSRAFMMPQLQQTSEEMDLRFMQPAVTHVRIAPSFLLSVIFLAGL